jgi:Mce-associated membrane protein
VDVAAVRPDELEPDNGAPPPDPSRSRGGSAGLVAALVVLAALVAGLVALLLQASHRNAGDDARRGAAAAARAEALNLTTISYQTADADLRRILAGSTGTLRSQFAEQQPRFADSLAGDRSRSRGNVLAVGVVSASATKGTARVVVAADATVTTATANGKDQSVLKHYRMVMRLVKVHGRWLVGDVAFAGEPQ